MALHLCLCSSAVIVILLSKGCESQQPVCGRAVRNTRIVGGQNASPGSWPWQASLHERGLYRCSGSLINNQWVMTTAHCNDRLDEVVLGRHRQLGSNPNEVSRRIVMEVTHPEYNYLTFDNDIALLKLSAPVNFSDYIQPVCLASADSDFHTGTLSWVAGWGANSSSPLLNILQEVSVPIVGNNECQCRLKHLSITKNMICAGFRAGGKDACQGDSGAALVTKTGLVWVQSGIVSFGEGCGRPGNPGGYIRVSRYQHWIGNVTGANGLGFVTYRSPGTDRDLNITCETLPTPPPPPPPTTVPTTTTTTTTTTVTMTTKTHSTPTARTSTQKCKGGSIFDGGESVVRSSHFAPHFYSLSVLVLSLYELLYDV